MAATSTSPNIGLKFSTPGTKTITLRVKSKNLYNEKSIQIVIQPEETPVLASYTASHIADAVEADGGTLDRAVLTAVHAGLPAYIRQQASMMIMVPTAAKAGTFYSFDNRPGVGTILPHGFVRNSQASAMNSDDMIWSYQPNEPVFEYTNSYQAQKQAVIDSILSNPNRKYVVDYLPAGYVTNGTVNYGAQLNNALDAGLDVIMPDFPIMVNNLSYTVNDGQRILFQANSEMRIQTGLNGVDYTVLWLRGKNDLTIIDAKIRGDKGHGGLSALSYERGQGISLSGCKNVTLYDPLVYDCWGDGIYLANYIVDPENIRIYNAVCHHNGRNNISITSGYNIYLHEPILPFADKSNPASGLDIEPNSTQSGGLKKLTNIFVYNPITWNNWWSGIQVGMGNRYDTVGDALQPFDCYIQNHFSTNDCWAHRITMDKASGDTTSMVGKLTFLNPELLNPVTYSPPPGGGSATTTTIMQDGDKAVIKYFLDDPGMTLEYLHPKAVLNNNEYDNAELTSLFNSINFQRTTKVVIIP